MSNLATCPITILCFRYPISGIWCGDVLIKIDDDWWGDDDDIDDNIDDLKMAVLPYVAPNMVLQLDASLTNFWNTFELIMSQCPPEQ